MELIKKKNSNGDIGIYLGFDISTTCIGISMFDNTGDLVEISHIELKTDKDILTEHRWIAKANHFKEYIQKFKEYNVLGIFIEEPLFGSNNAFTANLLMKFNGICSYLLYQELEILPEFISVYEVRKTLCPELIKINKGKEVLSFPKDLDKKDYIFNKVKYRFKSIEWLKDKKGNHHKFNYDMSDAVAVAYACLIKKEILSI